MTWRPPQPPFPAGDDPETIADWVELTIASTGKPLGRGKLTTTAAREDVDVSVVAEAWAELQRRSELLAHRGLFRVDERVAKPRRAQTFSLAVFLAALSLRTDIDARGRELFEHTVADLLCGLTGSPGLRIGAPRRSPRPTSLNDAVREYLILADEADSFIRLFPTTDQDLGADVVGWWSFADRRGGYLHLVGQCATGADWWEKLNEPDLKVWRDYVGWAVEPVRFFAMPFVARPDKFRRACRAAGLIIDRPRLLNLNAKHRLRASIEASIRKYCSNLYN